MRGHFTLERAQKIFCKVTADDHYKAYLDGAFMGKDLPRHIIRSIITMFWNWGHLLPGEHVLALHLYYQGLVNRVE